MCGIVGAISPHNVVPVLVDGLSRLEYRGYDSCGVALIENETLTRYRSTSRVAELEREVTDRFSNVGIAHTRWATHGKPSIANAHPHFSNGTIAVVHNGIIENHEELRAELIAKGYVFTSQTDTEVISHLIADTYREVNSISKTVRIILPRLKGAYALAVMSKREPNLIIAARHGSPLVLGVGRGEMFLASDALALVARTNQIAYLEEGDVADVTANSFIVSNDGMGVVRDVKTVNITKATADLGSFQHYMQKEIFEQPRAIAATIESTNAEMLTMEQLEGTKRVLILACGTSFYAGSVAKYWIEEFAGLPCTIEVASEYRYRKSVSEPGTLVVCISQSGETADTIAALKHAKAQRMTRTLTVCNVATSAMVRECSMSLITQAGAEIGVASTKAFTTQLVALLKLTSALSILNNRATNIMKHAEFLGTLPHAVQAVLALEPQIMAWADKFVGKHSALFLGRGSHFPIAQEGALKLKEISYIHAEAYSAGELKHGPLALVDKDMPVVIIAPNDEMLDKLKSNMQEVSARDGELFVLADEGTGIVAEDGINVIHMPPHHGVMSPVLHVVALQLLAYHTALLIGNDVDKPRNLAKSVTVE